MVKLPSREDLGAMPSARSGRPVATFNTTSIGKGMVNLGQGFSEAATNIDKLDAQLRAQEKEKKKKQKIDPVARHNAEMRYQEFKWGKQKELEDQMMSADANSVEGFADGFTEKYAEEAKNFLAEIPEELKPQYDLKLYSAERSFYNQASKFAHTTRKEASLANIEDMRDNTYYESVSKGKDLNEVLTDFTSLVESNPYLSANAKAKKIKEGAAKLEKAHIEHRIERGDDFTQPPAPSPSTSPSPIDKARQSSLAPRDAMTDDESPVASAKLLAKPSDGRSPEEIEAAQMAEKPLGRTAIKSREISPPVRSAIDTAAAETGLDPQLLTTFALIESSGNPKSVTVRNGKESKYKGLFQLSTEEFKKYGDGGNIFNAEDNARAAAKKIKVESERFEKNNGRTPDATDLYMMHQQGEAGYSAHMANPDKPAWDNMLSTGEGAEKGEKWAKKAIWGNIPDDVKKEFPNGVDSVTSRDFVEIWKNRVASFHEAYGGKKEESSEARKRTADDIDLSMYKNLNADDRHELALKIAKKKTEKYEGEQEELRQMLRDDVTSIEKTGVPRSDIDMERAKRVLGENELYKYETDRKKAILEYTATNDMDFIPNDQLDQRVNALVPKSGAVDYDIADAVYTKAKTKAESIRKVRNSDPAASVDNFPDVKPYLDAYIKNPDDPNTAQQLVKARLAAQDKVGIALASQSPISENEAKQIIAKTKGLEGKELTEAMLDINSGLKQKYGEYASMVGTAAIRSEVRNNEIAEALQDSIEKAFKGEPVSAYQKRKLDILQETAAAGKVFENPEWSSSGQVMGGTAASGPIRVNSIDEAMKLPAGTKFYDPNGNLRIR